MDIRTWQEAGVRAGAYSARHRARSPFSPLRPTPIAIGSLSTAAIAAFAFVAPGILHGGGSGAASTVLDGVPNRIAPLSPGGGDAAPGYVGVTSSPTSAASSSDSPVAPTSTATSAVPTTAGSSSPTPLSVRTPTTATTPTTPLSSPLPSQTLPSQSLPSETPTSPSQNPTTSPTTAPTTPLPTTPTTSPTTNTTAPFNSSAAISSALREISTARSQQGVSLLNVDSLLTKAAHAHSSDMARTGDFSHIGSDGSDPFSRAANLGCFTLSQELIAHGRPGDDVIGALLRDPSSRRALLAFWNSSIGISAQLDPATGDVYWSIELGWG